MKITRQQVIKAVVAVDALSPQAGFREDKTTEPYIIRPAFWTKGAVVIIMDNPDSRAGRLAHHISKGNYSKRQRGYIMLPKKAAYFIRLYSEGYDMKQGQPIKE